MTQQIDQQTSKEVIVEKIITNYIKVKRVYERLMQDPKNKKLEKSKIYDKLLSELGWDNMKRPMIRQLVNRYLKENSDEKKNQS